MSNYNDTYNNANTYNNAAPTVPPRPAQPTSNTYNNSTVAPIPVTSADIQTSNNYANINSTQSFTTNTGPDAHVKSVPATANQAPLVQPSRGIMHSLKKAFTTGTNVEMDPTIAHANDTLHANFNHTRELDGAVRRYQQAQQALQDAAVAVTQSFHHVLSDERNPYTGLSTELMRAVQTHPIVPSHGNQLTDLTSSAVADMEEGMGSIEQELRERKVKQSDVEYYLAKVEKLSNTQEQSHTNTPGKVTPAESERLERNIGKAKEVQLEYNQENERVIANMNALWRRRIVRLGPALTAFIAQNQIVYQDQVNTWQHLLQTSAQVNPDVVHTRYLTDDSTVLVPVGSAAINHSQHFNNAHSIVNRRVDVEQQQRLANENNSRQQAVQQAGGRLETVQQDVIVRSEEQMVWKKERFVTERVRLRKVVATEMVTITVPVRRERVEIDRIPVDGPGVLVSEEETAARLQRRNERRNNNSNNKNHRSSFGSSNNNNANNTNTYNNNTNTNTANTGVGAHNTLSNTTANSNVYDDEYDDENFELILCEERPRVVNDIIPVERIRMKKLTQVSTQHLEMDLRKEHIDFSAPNKDAYQQGGRGMVTQTGTVQTIAGQRQEGFTDTTQRANVVVLPNMVANQTAAQTVRADVDDVDAMRGIGVNQRGDYGNVNTVGFATQTKDLGTSTGAIRAAGADNVVAPTHPYYGTSAVADKAQQPDFLTNQPAATATTTSTIASTTTGATTASANPTRTNNYV